MRVHIKGGAWKNTEDEILKAAVMKYGKYQWGRIASLFNKKSAKQCKARWYEWLDPAIKKTEWSREEDEKLLHAAKVMPTQWRSIAAIVGRTAAQCLERYEKLLDAATGGALEGEEARKLRVGEVDPSPETKPALPDAVDMEEEEKEMLQEARARMANTSGKKVKRKAREKAMEEGRRLSVLQRKRELKAAGISVSDKLSRKKLKKFGPDWSAEVPFFHQPLPGFHDASDELAKPPPPVDFRSATLNAKTKNPMDIEEKKRKADLLKQKQKMEADPIKALEELHKLAKERLSKIRRASHLTTPAAQLSDSDIKILAKSSYDPELDPSMAPGSDATRGLLAPYQSTAFAAPTAAPTPRVDPLMQEASHQAYMRTLQTPLLGGDVAQNKVSSSLRLGAFKDALSTPNPLATPMLGRAAGPAAATSTPVPRRDHFGLNTPGPLQTPLTAAESFGKQHSNGNNLQSKLSALPAPKHTKFELDLPMDSPAVALSYSRATHTGPADVAELERQAKVAAQLLEQELWQTRSSVVRAGLPRPSAPPSFAPVQVQNEEDEAMRMIDEEMVKIIEHDCRHWPLPGRPPYISPQPEQYDMFTDGELSLAKALLAQEMESIKLNADPVSFVDFEESWRKQFEDHTGLKVSEEADGTEKKKKTGKVTENGNAAIRVVKLKHAYERVSDATKSLKKRLEPLEKKLSVVQGGFGKRNEMLAKELHSLVSECIEAHNDLVAFEAQLQREERVQPQRLAETKENLEMAKATQKTLQARYQALLEQKQSLYVQ
jgi:pre-mRNA-splicing factor CDC5/CEF1